MNLNTLKLAASTLKDLSVKHAPTILTTVGVIGTVTTAVLAGRGALKAYRILDHEAEIRRAKWSTETEQSDFRISTFGKKEAIRMTWQCYIPAIAMGAVTVTAIIGANRISLRRQAALASLYTLAERAAKKYEEKVVETLGEKKAAAVEEELAQEKLDETPLSKSIIHCTGRGQTLMFDMMTGRYFLSDLETVRKAVNDFNEEILNDGFMTLNAFYDAIGLEHVQMGDYMGWGTDYGVMKVDYPTKIADNGQPCIMLKYKVEPRVYS